MKRTRQVPAKTDVLGVVKTAELAVETPKDFVFLLLGKMVDELAQKASPSGDLPLLSHPSIDLDGVHKAIRARDLKRLREACEPFSAQCITEKWSSCPQIGYGLYQIHSLLKKYAPPGASRERAQAAYQSFLKYEAHCALYNKENWRGVVSLSLRHPDYLGLIEEVRADIEHCIGAQPNMEGVFDFARHGPGTSIGFEGAAGKITNYFKWSELPYTVSSSAIPYAKKAILSDQRWLRALIDWYQHEKGVPPGTPIDMFVFWSDVLRVTEHSRYETVPKNDIIDRSIGIEPTMNVFLQLGVDGVIRRNLKFRWGINLNSQYRNQDLARRSSLTGEDATVDLKGASDTVAIMAAKLLLPSAWFDLMMDLRTANMTVPKKFTGGKVDTVLKLEKISSMGNGFTFVLESLIFTAIARCAMRRSGVKGNLSVYGDDIILPVGAVVELYNLLDLFGFMVNKEKSFIAGPFRESCGVDCLNGINIRPFFLKEPVVDVTDIWYIHNSLYELERRLPWYWEISYQETRRWLRTFIPQQFKSLWGPPSECLDSYAFRESRRPPRLDQHRSCHLCLVVSAVDFGKRASAHLFRRLMVSLKPKALAGWDRNSFEYVHNVFQSGDLAREARMLKGSIADGVESAHSAFDVTMRSVVRYSVKRRTTWC